MPKVFKIGASDIEPLVHSTGACIASDRITVDGAPVRYMYRELNKDAADTGWRFFAGDESEEYCANSGNFGVYSVNTIANYDRAIIPLLEVAAPCAFERETGSGRFVSVTPTFEA